jgi:Nup53/35/40-type RNA recognition motif
LSWTSAIPDPLSRPSEAAQWVIVYGFKAGDVELLLSEFGKCGDIAQHGTFGAPASANWLYLQFQVAPVPAAYCVVRRGKTEEAACDHGTSCKCMQCSCKQAGSTGKYYRTACSCTIRCPCPTTLTSRIHALQDKWAAQRALYRDGEQLSRSLMIGVRPLDELHR